jgi:transcriptional regulator with XRE-family HTH domain
MDEDKPIGQRIAYWRQERNKTQEVLAGLVGRSASWLSKVERSEIVMDSISVLLHMARVLKVAPYELMPKLGLPPNGGAAHELPKGTHAIRHAFFTVGAPEHELDFDRLGADLAEARRLDGRGSYEALAVVLPALLVASRAAEADGRSGASWALAQAYDLAYSVAVTLGEVELALLAADRAIDAARRSGDALLVAACQFSLARVLMRQGWLDEAAGVCSNAADDIAPGASSSAAVWSTWGALHLRQAVAAARGQDKGAARECLASARTAAEHLGGQETDEYHTSFGAANVGAHAVSVALELGDPVEALRLAAHVDIDTLPVAQRRATFMIEVAHAYGLRLEDGTAVRLLLEAERHSPGTVRYSVLARELVLACLSREERYRTPDLRGLAERLKVAH